MRKAAVMATLLASMLLLAPTPASAYSIGGRDPDDVRSALDIRRAFVHVFRSGGGRALTVGFTRFGSARFTYALMRWRLDTVGDRRVDYRVKLMYDGASAGWFDCQVHALRHGGSRTGTLQHGDVIGCRFARWWFHIGKRIRVSLTTDGYSDRDLEADRAPDRGMYGEPSGVTSAARFGLQEGEQARVV